MLLNLLTGVLCFGFYTFTPADYQKGLEVHLQETEVNIEVPEPGRFSYTFHTNLLFNFTQEYYTAFYVDIPIHYGATIDVDSSIKNDLDMLNNLSSIYISFTNVEIGFDSGEVYKPFINFDFKLKFNGVWAWAVVDERLHYTFNDVDNLFTYNYIDDFRTMDNEFYILGTDIYNLYNEGYNDGKSDAKLTNNVFGWFGDIIDAFVNFLNLEIAPGINLGIIISIPIITGVLFFLLKALIN